jgi:hypothetical protein
MNIIINISSVKKKELLELFVHYQDSIKNIKKQKEKNIENIHKEYFEKMKDFQKYIQKKSFQFDEKKSDNQDDRQVSQLLSDLNNI